MTSDTASPSEKAVSRDQKTKSFARALLLLSDFYNTHPDFPVPDNYERTFYLYAKDACRFKELAFMLGSFEKKPTGSIFILEKAFGAVCEGKKTGVEMVLAVSVGREEVCTRHVVGTEVTPSHYIPESTREKVEWDCPGNLLSK